MSGYNNTTIAISAKKQGTQNIKINMFKNFSLDPAKDDPALLHFKEFQKNKKKTITFLTFATNNITS